MDFHVSQPTLSEDTNRKLTLIRKNILHDILKFNQETLVSKKEQ